MPANKNPLTLAKAASLSQDRLNVKKSLDALLKKYRPKITVEDGSVSGSIDIDGDLAAKYPNDNRWDYAVGHLQGASEKVYFIEIHSATSKEVSRIIVKAKFLKDWAVSRAAELWEMKGPDGKLYWLASDKMNIPKTSREYRLLSQHPSLRLMKSLPLK